MGEASLPSAGQEVEAERHHQDTAKASSDGNRDFLSPRHFSRPYHLTAWLTRHFFARKSQIQLSEPTRPLKRCQGAELQVELVSGKDLLPPQAHEEPKAVATTDLAGHRAGLWGKKSKSSDYLHQEESKRGSRLH